MHEDDCPGHPVVSEMYDSYPPMYAYKCSECRRDLSVYQVTEQKPADLEIRNW